MLAGSYDSLLDFLADLLVEDLAAEASADSEKAKGQARQGSPSLNFDNNNRNRVEDTAPTQRDARSA
jgi:hypothetical protein